MRISIVLMFLAVSSLAFAETYVDSKAELKIPIGQEQQSDMADTVQASVGKEFVITLDANATTGYDWQLAQPIDDSLVSFVSSKYVPDNTGLVGSGGKSVWTFRALGTGKTHVAFKYIRPWEKDVPPVKEATFMVDIRNEK